MKIKIKEKVITRVIDVEIIECDFCGAKTETNCNWYDGPNAYDFIKTEVSFLIGSNFPEGSFYTKRSIDLCGVCFEDKLIKWVKSHGVEFNTEEIST